jgi:hypothetical protein
MIPTGTLIHTMDGLVPIENVQKGTYVHTANGFCHIADISNAGSQDVISIQTDLGDFECTPDQQLAVGIGKWKIAKNITKGDALVCPVHTIKIKCDDLAGAWSAGYVNNSVSNKQFSTDYFLDPITGKVPDYILKGSNRTRSSYINGYRTSGAPLTAEIFALISSIGATLTDGKLEWPSAGLVPTKVHGVQNTKKVCETWDVSGYEYIAAQGFLLR